MSKILIADDNKAIAMTLQLKLIQEGFEVKLVENGKEALNLLESEKFDLVILDLIMPELNGFGVLEALKEKNITVPVIVASDLSQVEDFDRVKQMGAIDFFVKSNMSMTEMTEKIKQYLKNEPGSR
ncbi:MAG TPA: response regulator [Candidatus Staskawiczbacteria bacterium]|nr:response regulator [Candidatus Staskawiczbacteria bacterium]